MEQSNSSHTITRFKYLVFALMVLVPGIAMGAKYFDDVFSSSFRSNTSNIATSGVLRLGNTETLGWRNNANNGNLLLSVDSSDRLLFNGSLVPSLLSSDFTDSGFRLSDDGDATKKLAFELSGITAGQTRTITIPNFSGTLATLAGTETLTNKTLTAPIFSTISNTGLLTLPTTADTLVGRATTDTLTNKTLTTPITDIITLDDQASTPASPSAGFYKVYAKTDGKVYKLNSSGSEAELGGGGGGSSGINILAAYNRDAESSTTSWTASAGTFTTTTTSANVGNGVSSFSWDASATTQNVSSDARAIPSGLYGQNCLLDFYYKGFDANITAQAYDGTNVIASQVLAAATGFTRVQINFVCPSSGNIQMRLLSSADAAIGYWDEVHLGSATNISNVSQAKLYGKTLITGCTWARSNTAYGNMTPTGTCSYANEQNASSPASNEPGIKFASMPPGYYNFVARGSFYKSVSTTNGAADFRFNDGTTGFSTGAVSHSSSGGAIIVVPEISGSVKYTTAQSNVTIQIQCLSSNTASATACNIGGTSDSIGSNLAGLEIDVYYYPLASQEAVNSNTQNWRVDANISGANPSLGTADQASYIGIEDAGLTLTNNTGNGVLTAQIPCSSTNASTGTTCSVGNESVGVAFTIPRAGDVRACADFTHEGGPVTSIGNNYSTAFQIVETPNNAQTISQEGKTRVTHRTWIQQSTSALLDAVPLRVCGTFSFASAGQKTLRLMYEQLRHTGTINTNIIYGDALSTVGQRDIHWTVEPIDAQVQAPTLVGSITSNATGALREESARITCANTGSAVVQQTGSWISSVSNVGTGSCTVNITAGIFSATPICQTTVFNAVAATNWIFAQVTAASTSAISLFRAFNATAANGDIYITCTGAR